MSKLQRCVAPTDSGLATTMKAWYRHPMNPRQQRIPMSDQLRTAMEEIGGQPLVGSGFEKETPDPEFSESELSLADSLRGWTVRMGKPTVL